MTTKCIPLERLKREVNLINPFINKISDLYSVRGLDVVSRPHRLNFSALIYITEGQGLHYVEHQQHRLRTGSMLVLGKNQIHAFAKERSVDGYVLSFDCSFLSNGSNDPYFDLLLSAMVHINCVHHADEDIGPLFSAMVNEFESTSEFKDEIIRNLIRSIILKAVVPSYQHQKQSSQRIGNNDYYRLKKYIDEHFQDRPTAGDIALALGKSTKQLDKLAKDHAGLSVKELVDERVLVEAKRLLAFSQYSISDIANRLGFNEATNMTKFFKRHTDVNPKDFRQLCKIGLHQK
ncbi:AraC family transcriptional regulator [Photobacterium rosenbergii]|uniref:AraC family transcriptional regulator n=1 Tax=Photobacterium rosenbergii TaxID=294936 RepID=A0ABU3ZGQ9_9GAMM|nr:AraC family transcriptional regulator [Photobacterium rosenbergii]MDV5169310.1 AraC family transcriptional regulator [Photobacterium rosenbergii]